MPIYEYRCQSCGATHETMQKVSDPPPAACPSCAAMNTLERLVSRTSFQLKGGGWYSDLYGSVKKETGGKEPGGKSEPTSTGPTEKSPAAATASTTSTSGASASTGTTSGGTGSSAAP